MRRVTPAKPCGTPLQRALLLLDEAVRAAREDERADRVFAELLADRAARENARLLDREERP